MKGTREVEFLELIDGRLKGKGRSVGRDLCGRRVRVRLRVFLPVRSRAFPTTVRRRSELIHKGPEPTEPAERIRVATFTPAKVPLLSIVDSPHCPSFYIRS